MSNSLWGGGMYELAKKLFPICRSISGEGFRQSLKILDDVMGGGILQIHSIKSGTEIYDWVIPQEWQINDAYIITPDGEKICDFKKNNLHVLNYSEGIDDEISLDELQEHLYSIEDYPDAIPYVTSYYKKRWGFCIEHEKRINLKNGKYKVFIDAKHFDGVLNYADFIIPSTQNNKEEILISSYLCHPSMANNELSGPIVATFLAKWLLEQKQRKYNYRFVFIPETIGSIVYINKHLKHLQKYVKAGFALSCIGDDNAYSLVHSPYEDTLADKVALHTLKNKKNFKEFSFLYRGTDERQYCSPLVNLPVVAICRTKFGNYKEYHTSKDDLNLISQTSLKNSLKAMQEIIMNLEINEIYKLVTFCEPNLGKRNLYHNINVKVIQLPVAANFLAYCDGKNDVLDIADKLNLQAYELKDLIEKLKFHKLILNSNTLK
ncbi:DUF2172 domain-containing protein [Campylobacter sp. RM16704]|uniref:DUF2172 domain-containing protein n=1 Tax=Campylobacter sp. RM16704 TaxID=1500960 RepID=UPI00057C98BA|nr:DUF2172 domain-containing protein [Campylobacter sp. RM16704]AJC86757.1 putative protein (DUF2172 domain), putative M28 family zinc peptidase [Campylobacter sp. RM16704]